MKKLICTLTLLLVSIVSGPLSAQEGFDFDKYKGKVLYVDFWASWCIPCRASFPFMQDVATQHAEDLVIVAITVDKSRADADRFLAEFDVDFEIVYDPDGKLAEAFDLKGMPTSFLYDRAGKLLGSHVGFRKKDIDRLRAVISAAVEQ